MGSGSTGVACVKTGRSFIGIEIVRLILTLLQSVNCRSTTAIKKD
jgi:DNA modification methylase